MLGRVDGLSCHSSSFWNGTRFIKFPSWIFVSLITFVILTDSSYWSLWKTKKCDVFFPCKFELQILQLRSAIWYFSTKKSFFSGQYFCWFQKEDIKKDPQKFAMVFCSLVVFFGGDQLPSAPPPVPHIFILSQKNSWERNLCYENFCGSTSLEKSWVRKFHQWIWVVSLCPAEVGFDGKETVPWWWWYGGFFFSDGHVWRPINPPMFQSIEGWVGFCSHSKDWKPFWNRRVFIQRKLKKVSRASPKVDIPLTLWNPTPFHRRSQVIEKIANWSNFRVASDPNCLVKTY